MRRTVYSLLSGSLLGYVPEDRWYQHGTIDETPAKPFAVYRLSGTFPGVTARSKVRPVRLEVWIHDEPGSYIPIDSALDDVEGLLEAVVHVSAAENESISQVQWESRSPDLTDDGFRTICKMSAFTLIGKGQ